MGNTNDAEVSKRMNRIAELLGLELMNFSPYRANEALGGKILCDVDGVKVDASNTNKY